MTTIQLDDQTIASLVGGDKLVAVADASGKVVGFFAQVLQEYADQYAEIAARAYSVWGPNGPPRRSMTTAEVIAHLESLEKNP